MIKRICNTIWYALLLGLVFALEMTYCIVYLLYSTCHIWLSYLAGEPVDNVIISDLNDAADKARSEVQHYKDMMIRSWLGKLKWDDEQGIFVREFQSKKKEAMKKDDLLKKQGFLVNDDFESLFPPLDGKGKVVRKNQMTKDDKDDIDIDSMMIGF